MVGCIISITIFSPVLIFILTTYLFSKNKHLIDKDLFRYEVGLKMNCWLKLLYCLLFAEKSFRNVLYYRLGNICRICNIFLRENPTLHISTKKIGGGLLVVHGDATYIFAEAIGENLYVNQCVTIGLIGNGAPTIGNNVRIATGAIVIGPISIGDNVVIGAGSVVVKSVPSDCVVVGNPSRIVKRNGNKVNILL